MDMDWLTQEEGEEVHEDPFELSPSKEQQPYSSPLLLTQAPDDDDSDNDDILARATSDTVDDEALAAREDVIDLNKANQDDVILDNDELDGDDDDEVSSSSSSSSISKVDDDEALTLLERRARNIERNRDLMMQLELHHGMATTRQKKDHTKSSKKQGNLKSASSSSRQPTGMLLKCPRSIPSATPSILLSSLPQQFPGREAQIRKLAGLLAASTSLQREQQHHQQQQQVFVPAPIVVTGARGTGKTAVVRAVVNAVVSSSPRTATSSHSSSSQASHSIVAGAVGGGGLVVLNAYVDCATLDYPSIEEVTGSAYNQFWRQQQAAAATDLSSTYGRRGHNKRKRHHMGRRCDDTDNIEHHGNTNDTKVVESVPSLHPRRKRGPNVDASFAADKDGPGGAAAADEIDINEDEMEERVEKSRSRTTRRASSIKTDSLKQQQNPATTKSASPESISEMFTAVWKFGCALQNLVMLSKQQQKRCATILVLDHAERLLSLSSHKGAKDRINFLSQIMLLPQLLRLNLTVIAISKSSLLTSSRLHIPPAQGTLASCFQPICIRFDSYKQKGLIKRILLQSRVQSLIFGEGKRVQGNDGFAHVVRQSFLATLIQSLHDTTTDIKEYITLARSLWPTYVAPLHGTRIEKTLEDATKAQPACKDDPSSLQREILAILGRSFLPLLGKALERDAFSFDADTLASSQASLTQHEFSLLTKYLLLAAFLCHANRPDRDRHLFSIQKNGRRSRRKDDQDDGEDIAFGSSTKDQQANAIRPRSFPSERMLSVFISLIGLHASDQMNPNSLGSCAFYENLAHLRGLGLLREHPHRSVADPIRLGDTRYSCSLTREEASAIAKSISFPLDRYLL